MKIILYIICLLSISTSCRPVSDENNYFHKITQELKPIVSNNAKIENIRKRELEKFEKEKDQKYLISSKYVELFLYQYNTNKQLLIVHELLKLNKDRYPYISMTSNYNIAILLESTSPELAMNFIDKAIEYNKTLSAMYYYTGHLYHMKGRLYYNNKMYASAIYYFDKALKNFRPDDKLYISSMYNNFGLTYDQLNNTGRAIQETEKAIDILKRKTKKNTEDYDFLIIMKENLGFYYYKLKEYPAAEKLLLEVFEYSKDKKDRFTYTIGTCERLFDLYKFTGQKEKQKQIVDKLIHIEPLLKDTFNKITACEIVQKYYSDNNDLEPLKDISKKLVLLNHKFDDENRKSIQKTSDLLNKNLISSIHEKYEYELRIQKKKTILTITICFLLIVIIVLIALNIWTNKKSEIKDAEKQREILETNKKVLEQDVLFQKEKIKNLYQNLNLKIETEKAFLQNIKKIKRSSDTNSEQIFRDLHLKVSKLIQIDKKNDTFIIESSTENKIFLEKIEHNYPNLTNREVKLCIYFRMDLSSKEISALENTTTATVRVYKTRIKNKLGLGREDNLSTFLNDI
ncbi:tetratricopeptide repeat protein [Chryseobacterium sp. OV279]|uniref:tetratricopeptide repeat protein n=1 Tax=Chryseobacterium sp. OV279 TaxID=1500285 RepID=UPI00091D73B7|nr:LuxR C-terminal-related transcriptional regulator [Chryseobacterium sp. OV279]SHF79352.1 regulatory protein, luxR family [Chryseobacterium sp. OV279]